MYYMECAIRKLNNRKYDNSTKVIKLPFDNKFKYIETWRGMFFYKTNTPKKGDYMCGNFYLESDNKNFLINKNLIIDVADYLNKTYKIPYMFMNFFKTNKSVWLEIPFKVFGTFGTNNLNEIYKEMANEIDCYIKKHYDYSKTLDLTIYKWNGLIHSIGSYLPKTRRRVYKFSYWDLDEIYNEDDILKVKWDYFFTYKDVEEVEEAKQWFEKIKSNTKNKKCCLNLRKENKCKDCLCMNNLEKQGLQEGERNNSLYSYTLFLKENQNLSLENTINKIQTIFKNNKYVFSREAIRTIKSAYRGNKHFSCNFIRKGYSSSLCSSKCERRKSSNIYIPREFINILNKNKCNWKCYYVLIDTLYKNQIFKEKLEINISKERYKKDFLKNIEKLKNIGIINYYTIDDIIHIELRQQPKTIYTSYILFPISLYKTKKYMQIKKSIKLFLELLRCSFLTKNNMNYINVKIKTLMTNLKSTRNNIKKHMKVLKKSNLLFSKYIILNNFKKNKNILVKKLILKYKKTFNPKQTLLSFFENTNYRLTKDINNFAKKYNLEIKSFFQLVLKYKLKFKEKLWKSTNFIPKINNS